MDHKQASFTKLEKKSWEMALLAIVIILFLTLSILGLQFYNNLERYNSIAVVDTSYKYLVSLTVIILLACAYIISQNQKLARLTRAFLKEKEASVMLSHDVKTLESLLEVSSSISSQQELTQILTAIAKEIVSCFEADHASVMLWNEQANTIKTEVSVGKDADVIKAVTMQMGEGFAGHVINNGKPMLFKGRVDPKKFPSLEKNRRRITSSICVPLKIENRCIGVLNLNLIDGEKTFEERDLKLIEVFANNVATAINDARLYEQITAFNEKLEQKVRARTKELETANRIKSNFLSNISHELRTPLNAVVGFSRVLLEQHFGTLNEKQQSYAQNIANSGHRLDEIIEGMLSVSNLEAGDISLKVSRFSIKKLLVSIAGRMAGDARKKKVDFKFQAPRDIEGLKVNADQEKLTQVLENLIANAIKFTPEHGSVVLRAKRVWSAGLEHDDSDMPRQGDLLEISVADTGIGIEPDKQKEVFKDFYQIKGGLSGKTSGTGMGLGLAKRLVELHGGKIWVQSQGQDKGSRFVLQIPLNREE